MTALPDWDTVGETDAVLVAASLTGDRAAFAKIYDRYADRLHDFCVGMLRDYDSAADCVQETFCLAATRLEQLRDPDRLRPWLYAIARNEALRRLREWRREAPSEELPEVQSDDAGPDVLTARTELADLVAEVAGGLTDRDRAVLDLTFRHGLAGPELAEALGVSHSNANTLVARLRRTIERSLGALLVSRRARHNPDACPELREILDGWDGQFTILMRKRVSRHIESCDICAEQRGRLVSPAALLGATPVFVPAPAWLRDKTLGEMQLTSHGSALGTDAGGRAGGTEPADRTRNTRPGRGRRRRDLLAAGFIVLLAGSGALVIDSQVQPTVTITPTEVSEADQSGPPPPPSAPATIKPPVPEPQQTPPPPDTPPSNVPPPPGQSPAPPVELPAAGPQEQPADHPPDPGWSIESPPETRAPHSFTPNVVAPPPPGAELGDSNRDRGDGGRVPGGPNPG